MESEKSCTKCKETKPVAEFYHRKGRPVAACKRCTIKGNNAHQAANWERSYALQRRWKLEKMYGVNPADFDRLLTEQQGRCALCGQELVSDTFKNLAVDHDHTTGRVRGLLCSTCNRGLGLLGDTPEGIARAVAYLERAR